MTMANFIYHLPGVIFMTGKMAGNDNGIHDNGNEISYASAMTMVNDVRPFFGFHGRFDSNSYDIKLIALQAGCYTP